MIIQHNIQAMNGSRMLNTTTKVLRKSTEKLSSGYRINRAADDAAGLAISEKMRGQIRGLQQGSNNIEDGISLCQVADGALSEVNDMLHRVSQLSIQAANETNTTEDREDIQLEINAIVKEIDRIGNTTEFNTIRLFKGGTAEERISDSEIRDIDWSSGPGSDLKLYDLALGHSPFLANSNGREMNLRAVYKNATPTFSSEGMQLIYGSGSTSDALFRIKYTDDFGGVQEIRSNLSTITPTNYSYNESEKIWSRDFHFTRGTEIDVTITQSIQAKENLSTEKYYLFNYSVKNASSKEIDFDFIFNADTAYGGNSEGDHEEGYYMEGNLLNNFTMYSSTSSPFDDGVTSSYSRADGVPNSFSIINTKKALSFSEKIHFDGGTKPDSLLVGPYGRLTSWSTYDDLASQLGGDTENRDIAFSLLWNDKLSANGGTKDYKFSYGIIATNKDNNLKGVPITPLNPNSVAEYDYYKKLWIQAGANGGQGMWLKIGELSSQTLGIDEISVLTTDDAVAAIDKAENASQLVVNKRSLIGAQQNRLEHAVLSNDNTSENLQASESRIRDVDMADEMAEYSKYNILQQAGQSVLAQANQVNQGVLSLLQ